MKNRPADVNSDFSKKVGGLLIIAIPHVRELGFNSPRTVF
jgi:hypothetical protein